MHRPDHMPRHSPEPRCPRGLSAPSPETPGPAPRDAGRRGLLITSLAASLAGLLLPDSTGAQSGSGVPAARPAGPSTGQAGGCPAWLQMTQRRLQDEQPIDLCRYAGRVLLVVNTASYCGFTAQYQGLEALHSRYEPRGLSVLGFPSNDFGQQEPGSSKEIADFCENTFGVRFPMFMKSRVVPGGGRDGPVNPLFEALAARSGQRPAWNFHKYLVARDGRQVLSFASAVSPQDPALIRELERLLKSI